MAMRRGATVLFLSAVLGHACASEALPSVSSNPRAAPTPSPSAAASVRFLAGYPATLLYALDAAAGQRNRDPGYRAWVVGDEKAPWLEAYAGRRPAWEVSRRPGDGAGALTFEACAWEARELEDAIRCIEGVVGPADREVARTALREADRRMRPRWSEVGTRLARLLTDLEQGMQTEKARDLLRVLRKEAELPADVALSFDVILVAKPPGSHSIAQLTGRYLVQEVGEDRTVGALLGIAFHEVAHLAHALSPRRPEMEQAFLRSGDTGRLAGGVWDEVVATAFGNGLAAERMDPAFFADRSFYADEWIDTVGHALYREWKAGREVRLGPELAAHLVELVDREWPADQRPVARYLWYVTLYAQEGEEVRQALRDVQ
jgi:hypothetical protein